MHPFLNVGPRNLRLLLLAGVALSFVFVVYFVAPLLRKWLGA